MPRESLNNDKNSQKHWWVSIIGAVRSPLGFYVLVAIIVSGIMAPLAHSEKQSAIRMWAMPTAFTQPLGGEGTVPGTDQSSANDWWVRIIEAVRSPLGFYVLVAMMIFSGTIAARAHVKEQRLILVTAIAALMILVGIVTYLAYKSPDALNGMKHDPERAKMIAIIRENEKIAKKVEGSWDLRATEKAGDAGEESPKLGTCTITKRRYRLYVDGEWRDDNGQLVTWKAKQVFVDYSQLTYLFEVRVGPGHSALGVTQLDFCNNSGNSPVDRMSGIWGVLGSDLQGKVTLTRRQLTAG